jgi:hypothetical protein
MHPTTATYEMLGNRALRVGTSTTAVADAFSRYRYTHNWSRNNTLEEEVGSHCY